MVLVVEVLKTQKMEYKMEETKVVKEDE